MSEHRMSVSVCLCVCASLDAPRPPEERHDVGSDPREDRTLQRKPRSCGLGGPELGSRVYGSTGPRVHGSTGLGSRV
eukprot:1796682-Rhodomonas_salina.3